MTESVNMEMLSLWKFDCDGKRETNIQIDSKHSKNWYEDTKHSKNC